MQKMNLMPSFILLLSNKSLKNSPMYAQLFSNVMTVLMHLSLSCQGGPVFFLKNQKVLKVFIQNLDNYKSDLMLNNGQKQQDEETCLPQQ